MSTFLSAAVIDSERIDVQMSLKCISSLLLTFPALGVSSSDFLQPLPILCEFLTQTAPTNLLCANLVVLFNFARRVVCAGELLESGSGFSQISLALAADSMKKALARFVGKSARLRVLRARLDVSRLCCNSKTSFRIGLACVSQLSQLAHASLSIFRTRLMCPCAHWLETCHCFVTVVLVCLVPAQFELCGAEPTRNASV